MSEPSDTSSTSHRSWLQRAMDLIQREPKDKAQLMEILRDAEERHLLSSDMLGMIESVLQVSDMQAREVMVPKSGMVAIQSDSSLTALLPLVIESGHSRFPVIDADDDVIGILLAKDILKCYAENRTTQLQILDLVRPVIFIPQSKRLDVLLREFRVNRNHMAIIIDEYGHVAGLVTIEDVLEQIVGEIEDEYDIDEDNFIKMQSTGVYTVKASTPIEDFNAFFKTDFGSDEFDTIGGLVLQGFGHLPKRGESLLLDHHQFKVLHSDNRRIHLLEVTLASTKTEEDASHPE